jgi:dienelactone hydrolase
MSIHCTHALKEHGDPWDLSREPCPVSVIRRLFRSRPDFSAKRSSPERHILLWERLFASLGISTFNIDSFTGRGIVSTVTDQSQLGRLNMILDLYRSLAILAAHPRVDPNRIAVMGFSRGGQASVASRPQKASAVSATRRRPDANSIATERVDFGSGRSAHWVKVKNPKALPARRKRIGAGDKLMTAHRSPRFIRRLLDLRKQCCSLLNRSHHVCSTNAVAMPARRLPL